MKYVRVVISNVFVLLVYALTDKFTAMLAALIFIMNEVISMNDSK